MNTSDTGMNSRISRRTVFKGAGAVSLGILMAEAGFLRQAAAQSDSIQEILNITATTEAFGVTFLGAGIDSARNGGFRAKPIPEPVIAILEAARAQEQFHLDFFRSAGGQLLTDTFTLPDPKLLTDYDLFFGAIVMLEAREIAAQLAAFETFTQLKRPDLLKVSFQYAAEEAEHRVLANYALGARPANNVAFEARLYSTVREHLAFLREAGLVGGRGPAVKYPGPGMINPANVIERTPGGPAVTCTAAPGRPLPETGVEGSPVLFPETGYSLEGEFLSYWQSHGGLAVFGYPIASARQADGRVSQYLERARFELHPENQAPYNVLLGRLGVEALERQGRDWRSFPKAAASAPHYFKETGHAIAPQFWGYWSGHGLEFDGRRGVSMAESLALFGYPVSEAQMETNADGHRVLTQWFERARFEYHPSNPAASRVLLGRLGAELRNERGR